MVVKDKAGRHRYILFAVKTKRDGLKNDIASYTNKIKLVFYDEKYGVVKCYHKEKEKVINFLNSLNCKTLFTSGTMKKIRKVLNNFLKDEAS